MAREKKTWFNIEARAGAGAADIMIFNEIGDWGITASDFHDSLTGAGPVKTLNIKISSPGGDVGQGFAIYNMLNRHAARKIVTVEGLAASMASVIAMAGDEVIMPSNAMMMIHNPWGALMGEADQIKSFGEALEVMQDNIAQAYVDRTGLPMADVLAMMAKETWLSAAKATELGFADTIEAPLDMAASFNVSKFNRVPQKLRAHNGVITMSKKPKNADSESDSASADAASTVKTEAEIRAEINAKNREVRSLCNLAGKPNLADGFIDTDASISAVIKALDEAKAKDNGKAKELNTSRNATKEATGAAAADDQQRTVAVIDHDDIYARWNGAKRK